MQAAVPKSNEVSVLLVEDEKVIALDIRKKLERLGYAVTGVSESGEDAIQSYNRTKPDLVIMDIRLVGTLDGIQTAGILQKDYNVPVVMITGYTDNNLVQRVQDTSPFGFLFKPFEEQELDTVLRIALNRYKAEQKLARNEIQSRLLLELAAEPILIVDHIGNTLKLNSSAADLIGTSKGELIGKHVSEFFDPEPSFLRWSPPVRKLGISSGLQELDLVRPDGVRVPVEISCSTQIGDLFQVFIRDLRLRDERTENLRLTARVFENIVEGVFVTDSKRRIVTINQSFSAMTGFQPDELIDKGLQIFKSRKHARNFYVNLWRELEKYGKWEGELYLRKKNLDDSSEWASLSVLRDSNGNITHYVGIFIDLSERKRYEQKLYHLAHHDPLTSLPNRNLYIERLQRCLIRAARSKLRFALLFIDLDKFKHINDTKGHDAGDQVLIQISERISQCLRKNDTVSRFGGDEFNVLIEEIRDPDDAALVARKIIASLSRPLRIEGQNYFITPSIGIAVYPEDGSTGEILFQNADKAMYRAKEDGGNQYNFASTNNEIKSLERKLLFTGIERGLAEQQFRISFQPVLRLRTGEMNHLRASLYWDHPSIGPLHADRFQRLIVENSLSLFFAIHALEEVYLQIDKWLKAGYDPGTIELDIPATVIEREAFFESIDSVYTRNRSLHGKLVLSVTEKSVRRSMDHSGDFIERLKTRKIMLSIREPLTGFLSLYDYQILPIHSFRTNCSRLRANMEQMVSAAKVTAGMAKGLGIHCIAEALTSKDDLDLIDTVNCDLYERHDEQPMNDTEVLARFADSE